MFDGQPFCCHGCKAVFQILNEKKLDKYYEIQPMSGIKVDRTDVGDKYEYLDNGEILAGLLDFSDGGISKIKLFVPGIHCASCIWLLENLYTLNPGILQSFVNFPKKTVSITFKDQEVSLREIVELLASIHYAPEITLDQLDKQEGKNHEKDLLIKIGIAGFSLLNVMLYNFPEYLPGGDQLEEVFVKVFGWLSFILALPVVLYSASDYYLSAFKGLKHKIINIDLPITLGIFTLFAQSTYDILSGSGIGYLDSLVGLVFFLLIGKWYQGRTYQALSFERDYKSYFPVAVSKTDGAKTESVPIKNLLVGDRIIIRNQELIPTDAKLLKGKANIDYSFVTGESMPVNKKTGEIIFAGGRQVGSSIELEIFKTVEQSYLTQLWNQDSNKKDTSAKLNSAINKISEYFTVIILLIAFGAGLYWLVSDSRLAIYAFTSVLIIACPCALALTVPFTFGSTLRAFGRKGFYLKNTDVIEHLYKTNHIVFDKTGTLTINSKVKTHFEGDALSEEEKTIIKSVCSHSSHPLSTAIANSIKNQQLKEIHNFLEIPAMGISANVDGGKVNIGSRKFVMGKEETETSSTNVYVLIHDKVVGHYKIENVYREGLQDVINNFKKKYKLYLLSGDNDSEKENLKKIFGANTKLLFNQSPTDKKEFIKQMNNNEANHVLMIGDGLNDAGALMESEVGLTVADDIFSFSPACEGIIESSKFKNLYEFVNFTKVSMKIVKISFIISFLYNAAGIFIAVQGILSPIVAAILMPVSSISVVAFATLSIKIISSRKLS
ncbi:MAG: HAD-IC family P-type ATPase [Chlorobi bacterium]|nr:HAD-IC family P-type ATPase [Chlorobiota bacterium]